jgi:AI-2 transport protein TqsA
MDGSDLLEQQNTRSVLRLTLGLGGFVVILAGLAYLSGLVNQVLLAAFLTLLLVPVADSLQKRGMKRQWANLLIVLAVLAAVVLLGTLVILSLANLVKELPVYGNGLEETNTQLQNQLESMGIDGESVANTLTDVGRQVLAIGASILANLVGYAVDVVFILLMFAFMLFDAVGVRARISRAFSSDRPLLVRIQNSTSSVATYLRLLTVINFAIGVGDTILLWALGIPNPVLWGLLAFLTGYIPYIGFWIAMIPVLVLAFLQGGALLALIVVVGYWLINGTLSNIVAPRIYGKGLNLSPVVTFVTVLFWGAILGPVGAMIAVPLTAILNSVLLVSFPETKWLAILMRQGNGEEE